MFFINVFDFLLPSVLWVDMNVLGLTATYWQDIQDNVWSFQDKLSRWIQIKAAEAEISRLSVPSVG